MSNWGSDPVGWEPRDRAFQYELWRYHESGWYFLGYRVLSLRQVLEYERYGYTVRRLVGHRSDTLPLFPLLGSTGQYPTDGLD